MKRRSIPVGLLGLLTVLALGAVGVVYALWSDMLTIDGTVRTGSVDVELSIESFPGLPETDPCTGVLELPVHDNEGPTCPPNTKDVGVCTAVLSADGNRIAFTIVNGYPSYECHLDYDIHVVGSIPVKLRAPKLDRTGAPATAVDIRLLGEDASGDKDRCYDDGHQLHFSERVFCELEVHVRQEAAMGATYTFTVTHEALQYNEFTP